LKVSVVVCTYNRCELLRKTLQSLIEQDYPSSDYEVIVVDNCSTDRTKDIVYELLNEIDQSEKRIRYEFESLQSLTIARNLGIQKSEGHIVAFIDDDAVAEKDWIQRLVEIYDTYLDAVCVGGKVLLSWETTKPSWWEDKHNSFLSGVDYGNKIKKLHHPESPYGTNISFKKEFINKIGLFNTEIGRVGDKLLDGDEVELCLRIERNGGHIYYTPFAVVHHLVQPHRVNTKYLLRRAFYHGRSMFIIERINSYDSGRCSLMWTLRSFLYSVRRSKGISRYYSIAWELGYLYQRLIESH